MLEIREYHDDDFFQVSTLIEKLFKKFIIPDASPEGALYWTDFHSLSISNKLNITKRFNSCPIRFVAVINDEIVGVVMGTATELVRIFVCEPCHGKGIGEKLVESFEAEMTKIGVKNYKITASLYAIPFLNENGLQKINGREKFSRIKSSANEKTSWMTRICFKVEKDE